MRRRAVGLGALVAALTLVLAGCAGKEDAAPRSAEAQASPSPTSETTKAHDDKHSTRTPPPRPLRPGEERLTVEMPEPYLPSAPTGVGTDDYRCFLLDPGL